MKRTSGSTFVVVPLDELKKVVFRAFHALDPKMEMVRGEQCISLSLNEDRSVEVYVMTSVQRGSTQGADVGSDAIRVGIWGTKKKRFLEKTLPVYRTKNWKTTLQDRIEEALEKYDDNPARWERQADPSWEPGQGRKPEPPPPPHHSEPPPPPAPQTPKPLRMDWNLATEKQVRLLVDKLLKYMSKDKLKYTYGIDTDIPLEDAVRALTKETASSIISQFIGNRPNYQNRRYADEGPNDGDFAAAVVGYIFEGEE